MSRKNQRMRRLLLLWPVHGNGARLGKTSCASAGVELVMRRNRNATCPDKYFWHQGVPALFIRRHRRRMQQFPDAMRSVERPAFPVRRQFLVPWWFGKLNWLAVIGYQTIDKAGSARLLVSSNHCDTSGCVALEQANQPFIGIITERGVGFNHSLWSSSAELSRPWGVGCPARRWQKFG